MSWSERWKTSLSDGFNNRTNNVQSEGWISKPEPVNIYTVYNKNSNSTSHPQTQPKTLLTPRTLHSGATLMLIPTLLSPYFSSDTSVRLSNRLQKIEKRWPLAEGKLWGAASQSSVYLSLLTRNIRTDRMLHCDSQQSAAKGGADKSAPSDGGYAHKGGGLRWMVHRRSTYRTSRNQRGWYIYADL